MLFTNRSHAFTDRLDYSDVARFTRDRQQCWGPYHGRSSEHNLHLHTTGAKLLSVHSHIAWIDDVLILADQFGYLG
jgi:hypothetical protein